MYKQVMMLGLLLERPMYGQQIREVIELHHDTFAQFIKKPTIYYQLDRLVADGYLEVRSEPVEAPGPGLAHEELAMRERDVYHITEKGRLRFYELALEKRGVGACRRGHGECNDCDVLERLTVANGRFHHALPE